MKYEQLKQLTKIELHCHLDGSLTLGCIQELLNRKVEPSELQVSEDCRSLAEYLEKFDLPLQGLQTDKGLRRAGYDFILNVASENVKYIEVRFAPLLSVNENLSVSKVIESVLEGLEQGKKETGVQYNVITCAMRHHTEEQNKQMLKIARDYLGDGVCAADLAGNEAAFPMSDFLNLFKEVKKMGMPFVIHAGECGSVKNIIDSINCGASRIGHGIAMAGHSEAIKLCAEKNVGIEMCPISNLQTKAAEENSYPIREFLDNGLLVTVNTDNRTVSDTTITKEFDFIQKHYGITDSEINLIIKNAINVSFADDSIKAELHRYL